MIPVMVEKVHCWNCPRDCTTLISAGEHLGKRFRDSNTSSRKLSMNGFAPDITSGPKETGLILHNRSFLSPDFPVVLFN